jgi:nanoRNase/pAp phosphatase (c-di-AMP/oligoRNAs hydrolase)
VTSLRDSKVGSPARQQPRQTVDHAELRVRQLVQAAKGKKRGIVLTHDNPDPDSLSSAIGLAYILESLAGLPMKVAFGGIVGRAENRALVKVLKLPVVPVSRIVFDDYDFIALVDTQPECTNHSLLPRTDVDAVVDHHPARPTSIGLPFADVGGDYGATASIVTSYFRASGIKPTSAIATALFYGIKSDTRDMGREFEPVDVDNYEWLFPQIDHAALSQIEHPSLPATYFAAMHHAIEQARRHDETIVADLDQVYAPDIVAEVADRLLTLDGMRWSLVLGEYEGNLYLSIRTADRRMNAGRLARDIIGEEGGSAGGHGSMAGGRLALPDGGRKEIEAFKTRLIRTFLKELEAPQKGEPIV